MANGLSIQNNKIKKPVNWSALIKNTWNETQNKKQMKTLKRWKYDSIPDTE